MWLKRQWIRQNRSWYVLIGVGVLIWILVSMAFVHNFQEKKIRYLESELEGFSAKINTTMRMYESFSDYTFKRIIHQTEVLNIMTLAVQGDATIQSVQRELLYEKLIDEYRDLENLYFRQLHFHLPNGDSFLRFHAPDLYGDNLMAIRDSIRIANTEKRKVFGFEEGRIFNGYRFVYPLLEGDHHLGSVEISVSMGGLIEVMDRLYPETEIHFFIDQSVVEALVFESHIDAYETVDCFEGYMLDRQVAGEQYEGASIICETESAQIISEGVNENPEAIKDKRSFSNIVQIDGASYLVNFYSVENLSQVPVAYLVGVTPKSDDLLNSFELHRDLILVALLFFLLFFSTHMYAKKQQQLKRLANTDALTGLSNRHRFMALARQEIERFQRYQHDVSLILLDLDHFKTVNDRYGHQIGDEVLIEFSQVLKSAVRTLDCVARWGGEEFIVLLPNTGQKAAEAVAERIRLTVSETQFPHGQTLTVSLGVSSMMSDELNLMDDLINTADQRMYLAKVQGRDRVVGRFSRPTS